jgi:hypothetical protein
MFAFSKVFTYRYLLSANGQSLPLAGTRSSAVDEIHGNENLLPCSQNPATGSCPLGPHD